MVGLTFQNMPEWPVMCGPTGNLMTHTQVFAQRSWGCVSQNCGASSNCCPVENHQCSMILGSPKIKRTIAMVKNLVKKVRPIMGVPKMSGSKNQTSGTSACVWCLFKDPVMVAFINHPFLGTVDSVAQFFTIKNHWAKSLKITDLSAITWTPSSPSRKTPGMSPCPLVAWLPHRWWSGWWWGTWVDKVGGWMARITNKKVGKTGEIGGSPMNCQKLRIWPWFDPQKGLTWQKSKAKLSLHFTLKNGDD